jgi:hypothetical protein
VGRNLIFPVKAQVSPEGGTFASSEPIHTKTAQLPAVVPPCDAFDGVARQFQFCLSLPHALNADRGPTGFLKTTSQLVLYHGSSEESMFGIPDLNGGFTRSTVVRARLLVGFLAVHVRLPYAVFSLFVLMLLVPGKAPPGPGRR